ncbi:MULTISPECIES: transposase [unclassified Bradyrhizobium]|uniref:transposase n=1 Tax=unclassified Bradyrhizobium TaxID=2631580 RepID=UPI0035C6B89E
MAESFEEGANISEVARRHGVVRGLLTVWRRKCATAASFQAPGLPSSGDFSPGRGRLLQLLCMSLSPCCRFHPAEMIRRIS